MLHPYLLIASILLLPLIPAFVIFKFLPDSSIRASGLFAGLTLNTSGAFGGYFVLVLLASQLVPRSTLAVYTMETYLRVGDSAAMDPSLWKDKVTISLQPGPFSAHSTGRLTVDLAFDPEAEPKPSLSIDAGPCGTVTVDLKREAPGVHISLVSHEIKVDTLTLETFEPDAIIADSLLNECRRQE